MINILTNNTIPEKTINYSKCHAGKPPTLAGHNNVKRGNLNVDVILMPKHLLNQFLRYTEQVVCVSSFTINGFTYAYGINSHL